MADVSIPREAVDKAARRIHTGFEHAAPIEQAHAREAAMDALNAAAPLIVAAAFDRAAGEIVTTIATDESAYGAAYRAGQRAATALLRLQADLLRAQS